jgi:Fic family protein
VDVDRLHDSPIGHLEPITVNDARLGRTDEHWAFVPDPLPDLVDLAPETVDLALEAALALGRLDQAGRDIPNPALLRRPTLRREAQSTSALEGTYAPLTEVLEADPGEPGPRSPELSEILNYVAAAEHGYAWVRERGEITSGLICELHTLLMRGAKSDQDQIGRVRTIQVVIGAGGRVAEARFIPPPPGTMLEAGVRDLFTWLDRARSRQARAIIDCALAHYQFETLHPLHDGNGRIGRLMVVLQLLAAGLLSEPLFTVSPWFESRRRRYQDELQLVSETGDFNRWVAFFCEAVRDQAGHGTLNIQQLRAFQDHARGLVRGSGRHSVAVDIAGDLIERPVLNATATAARYNVTYVAANNAIARLVELGLLREITGRGYDRVFSADAVVQILER